VEGKNLAIECRFANFRPELLPEAARDLVRLNMKVTFALTPECGVQKLVMQQRSKCGVTRQAQVPRGSFGMLAEGGALPRRMELPGPTSGALAQRL
jgi:hypothetical protein